MPTFEQYMDDYRAKWAAMHLTRSDAARAGAQAIVAARRQYERVRGATGVPWHVIGIIHRMECGGSFRGHLHNGDPLTSRTRQVPRGRPISGSPPFTWEDSACDALRYDGLDKVADWSPERIAWCLEKFNGFGYRGHGVPSPYLWAGSDQYSSGKYVSDGVWSSAAVSQQIGGMVLLKALHELDPSLVTGGDSLPEAAAEFPKAEKEMTSETSADEHAEAHAELKQESWFYSGLNWIRKKLGLPVAGTAAGASLLDDPVGSLGSVVNFAREYGLRIVAVAAVVIVAVEITQAVKRQRVIEGKQ